MKRYGKIMIVLLPLLAVAFLAGCAGEKEEMVPQKQERPAWVDKGSGAFEGEMGAVFFYPDQRPLVQPAFF